MSFFSEKQIPTWAIITGGIVVIVVTLAAVSLPKTFPRLKSGSYLGVAHIADAGQPAQEIPFMISVAGDEDSVSIQTFTASVEAPQLQHLIKTYRFLRTAVNPITFPLGSDRFHLIGRLTDDLGKAAGKIVSNDNSYAVGTWSITPIEPATSDTNRLRTSGTMWKQVQELTKIRDAEDQHGANQKDEISRLQQTLTTQLEIKREGEKKLALSIKAVDEAATKKKKLDTELQVLRGRIMLAQKLSPQGKFYALSRRAFQNEARWFTTLARVSDGDKPGNSDLTQKSDQADEDDISDATRALTGSSDKPPVVPTQPSDPKKVPAPQPKKTQASPPKTTLLPKPTQGARAAV